ncbi:MAG TPA: DUF4142 domain-containing protein [Chitinophagaceae bacterium]|nr:DUF4142 domain-containing protein [Chitinophagaceae bacterium]
MKKLCFLSAMILSLTLFQACSSNGNGSKQKADSINHANEPMSKKATSDFLVEAAIINMNEIKLGSIAQKQAANPRVKDFAAMIVHDHQKVNKKLKTLAQKKQVKLPDSLNQEHQSKASKLKEKKGNDFDEAFVKDMVKGHKDAINTFQKAKRNVDDGDVRSFIEKTLPGLQKHLDSAETIQYALKGRSQ